MIACSSSHYTHYIHINVSVSLKSGDSWNQRLCVFKYFFISFAQYSVWCSVAAAAAKSSQSCPALCDPIDGSPPGSAVPGILQARTLGWVAISFSNACKWKVKVKSLSHVLLFKTARTAAYQVPPSMGFSRREYWNGLPLPSPDVQLALSKCLINYQMSTWIN